MELEEDILEDSEVSKAAVGGGIAVGIMTNGCGNGTEKMILRRRRDLKIGLGKTPIGRVPGRGRFSEVPARAGVRSKTISHCALVRPGPDTLTTIYGVMCRPSFCL